MLLYSILHLSGVKAVNAKYERAPTARRRIVIHQATRPGWPMIVFRTPKGWTGPKLVDGKLVEGTWRAHQVPIAHLENPEHLKQLEEWMKSYIPGELFD
jgi:xylulose-5-phosphate/fructose-6-phosphate phosphoketolase